MMRKNGWISERHIHRNKFRSLPTAAIFAIALLLAMQARPAQADEPDEITFAVIGDYGSMTSNEAAVATLVKQLKPDFIVTVGDNNYGSANASGFDAAIGQYFSDYIGNYKGKYGPGSLTNRFWPALGNHDYSALGGCQAYVDYFTLPGNERYYDFVQGPVHFFIIDSDRREPDGNSRTSKQAQWLQSALAASTSTWNFVALHHAPFSSASKHGPNAVLQWPFKAWGAHAVFAGHDHIYERFRVGGLPYFVNGIGGKELYETGTPLPQSLARFSAAHGAMRVKASKKSVVFETYSVERGGTLVDSFTLAAGDIVPDLIPPAATWKYLDDGSDLGVAWRQRDFDDSHWKQGQAQLGYGDGDETTTVNFGRNSGAKHVTTYFRHSFDVADASAVRGLLLSILRDDGAVAYLNGTEVFRTNMPSGNIDARTFAISAVAGPNENTFEQAAIDPCLLRNGTNVLAVEVHQSSGSSSDLSFDLMLTPTFGKRVCGGEASR